MNHLSRREKNEVISRFVFGLSACLFSAVSVRAQQAGVLPRYEPEQIVSGTIRIWGDDQMRNVTRIWEDGFRKYHPRVNFHASLMGTGTGMAGLYTGVADLAFMGRMSTPKEIMAFEWVFNYKPMELEIMTGSLNAPGKSPALVVFTHKDNPISQLTLAQLDAIFSCEHLRGASTVESWGQLGLSGTWAQQAIHAYGYDAETGPALFFRQTVLIGSSKWNWGRLREFKDVTKSDGSVYDSGQQILDALASDRYGIAVSTSYSRNPQVKPVALSAGNGGHYYGATKENLIAGLYPLTRLVRAYVNRPPSKPMDPAAKEFLRYILSHEGQAGVLLDRGYLPLNKDVIDNQLKKLQ